MEQAEDESEEESALTYAGSPYSPAEGGLTQEAAQARLEPFLQYVTDVLQQRMATAPTARYRHTMRVIRSHLIQELSDAL